MEKDRKLRNLKLSYYPYHLMMTMINIMMQHLSITFTLTTPLESKGGAWSSRLFHIASCSTTFSYESIIPSPALPTGSLSAKLTSRHVSSSSSLRTTVLPGAGSLLSTGVHRHLHGVPCTELDLYHQTDMKKSLWIEKAEEFSFVDVECLMSWYKSMRTRFGKLSRLMKGYSANSVGK